MQSDIGTGCAIYSDKTPQQWAELLYDCGKKGYHVVEMANALNVSHQTLYNWSKQHPQDFGEAFAFAKQLSEGFHWKAGRDAYNNKDFNAKVWEFTMRAKMKLLQPSNPLNIPGFLNAKSHTQRIEAIFNALGSELISPQDAHLAVNALKTAISAENDLLLTERVKELETMIAQKLEK